jgi:hypothetical protein
MLTVTDPALSVAAAEEYPPLDKVIVPVGVGVPLTATVTVNAWVVVMLVEDGLTSTLGVALTTVTLGEAPEALL